ncbi:GntR family transcriptional regulator [Miniphocaeibacter massiliensis]|uniref:GntR family transcriptional regulator n=1 Tax=Miniphocaeibacter massiliensis TaxID=2041841 RepID=UPI000C081054|nr:GntR family transcriptional regulator [Miniphocaeibacter massiliensis]
MATIEETIKYYSEKEYNHLSEKAYDILQELIVTMILKPGKLYSEAELSSMLEIGRTPVREAIKKLEDTMLLEIVPRSGVKISEIRLEDFYLQMEVRKLVERLIVQRATKFSTNSEKVRFKELSEEWKTATINKDSDLAVRVDDEFHRLMIDCARNPYAKKAIAPFHLQERRLFYIEYDSGTEYIKAINDAHSRLMFAISQGKEENAALIFDEMMENIELLGTKWLKF